MAPLLPAASRARSERRWLLIVLALVCATATCVTIARHPSGVTVSSDPGYPPVPVLLLLAPAVLTSALVLLLPRGKGAHDVRERHPRRLRAETAGPAAIAACFPLLVPLLPLPEDHVLLKLAMLLLLPCLVLGLLARRSATAITAGLGEEVLFRRLLQPRLEVKLGGAIALLLTSLPFRLMHVSSHGEGPLWADALQVIAVQGTTGIALGLIWGRWHRLGPCVLAHVLLNGFAMLLHLLGVLG